MREFSVSVDAFNHHLDYDFREEAMRTPDGAYGRYALRGYLRHHYAGGYEIFIRKNPETVGFACMCILPADTPLEDAKEAVLNFLRLGMDLEPGHGG